MVRESESPGSSEERATALPAVAAVRELGALDVLDEASVTAALRERALAGEPYTGAAGCLVAVNPCAPRPELYGAAAQAAHAGERDAAGRGTPHVFAVAARAFGALSRGEAAHHVSSATRALPARTRPRADPPGLPRSRSW
jgi:myosin heavy subunit